MFITPLGPLSCRLHPPAFGMLPCRAFVLASPSFSFATLVSLAVDLMFKEQKQITLPPKTGRAGDGPWEVYYCSPICTVVP